MMFRWRWIVLIVLVAGSALVDRSLNRVLAANEVEKVDLTPAKSNRPITLRDRLVTGLQARLKSEVAFVDAVVTNVQNGRLPQEQVDQTFFWARDRAAHARDGRPHRPIIYFQPAMKARADRLHVAL